MPRSRVTLVEKDVSMLGIMEEGVQRGEILVRRDLLNPRVEITTWERGRYKKKTTVAVHPQVIIDLAASIILTEVAGDEQ